MSKEQDLKKFETEISTKIKPAFFGLEDYLHGLSSCYEEIYKGQPKNRNYDPKGTFHTFPHQGFKILDLGLETVLNTLRSIDSEFKTREQLYYGLANCIEIIDLTYTSFDCSESLKKESNFVLKPALKGLTEASINEYAKYEIIINWKQTGHATSTALAQSRGFEARTNNGYLEILPPGDQPEYVDIIRPEYGVPKSPTYRLPIPLYVMGRFYATAKKSTNSNIGLSINH